MTSCTPSFQSTRGNLVIKSMRRFALIELFVSTLTLLLLLGCNSNSQPTAKTNQPKKDSTNSIDNDSTDKPEVTEANRPDAEHNALKDIKETATTWTEGTNRVNIEGDGIMFPGTRFCQMMARPEESLEIE